MLPSCREVEWKYTKLLKYLHVDIYFKLKEIVLN